MRTRLAINATVTVLLAACSAAAEIPPTVAAPPLRLPTPAAIVPLDERLLAAIDIRFPDEVVAAQGYIWVKTDDGHVVQVDPATNMVIGAVKVDTTSDPYHYCQGLSSDGDSLWVCSAAGDADHHRIDVVQVDPSTRQVLATVAVNKIFDQFAMPLLLNQVWVLADSGTSLVGVNATTGAMSPALDLGVRCFQLVAQANTLLAACTLDDLVLRIDPELGRVTERVTVDHPRNIYATATAVWVARDNAVVRLNPQTLAPVVEFTGLTGDLFVSDEAVWVRTVNGFLYRIDPASNAIVEQIESAEDYSMGSVLAAAGSLWTTAGEDDVLLRLSIE